MKSILSVITVLLLLVAFAGDSALFAQDSTRTQTKQKIKHQIKHQKGEQVKAKKGKAIEEEEETNKYKLPEGEAVKTRKGEDKNSQGVKTREENKQKEFKDDDGDGIPNGQDPDYEKPQDGKNLKQMKTEKIKKLNKKTKNK